MLEVVPSFDVALFECVVFGTLGVWFWHFSDAGRGVCVASLCRHSFGLPLFLLETNGRKSAGKGLCHLNMRFLFVTDQKEKGFISIEFCLTDQMIADYMTKPLQWKEIQEILRRNNEFAGHKQFIMYCYISTVAD